MWPVAWTAPEYLFPGGEGSGCGHRNHLFSDAFCQLGSPHPLLWEDERPDQSGQRLHRQPGRSRRRGQQRPVEHRQQQQQPNDLSPLLLRANVMMEQRPYLEPIQEESEQEDETGGSGTEGEADFQSEVGVEMEEEVAEEEEEEEEEEDDDDAPLRVLRPRRLSRSLSTESFLQSHSADSLQGDLDNRSVSDAMDLSDEAQNSWQQKLGNEKQAIGQGLKEKNLKTPETSMQRKRKKKNHKETSQCLFPPWVVELMVNIEEAKKHRLVVE